jgi:hypothetical protein
MRGEKRRLASGELPDESTRMRMKQARVTRTYSRGARLSQGKMEQRKVISNYPRPIK